MDLNKFEKLYNSTTPENQYLIDSKLENLNSIDYDLRENLKFLIKNKEKKNVPIEKTLRNIADKQIKQQRIGKSYQGAFRDQFVYRSKKALVCNSIKSSCIVDFAEYFEVDKEDLTKNLVTLTPKQLSKRRYQLLTKDKKEQFDNFLKNF